MRTFPIKQRLITTPIDRDKDRVKQLASELRIVVNPVLAPNVHGWRTGHSLSTAMSHITQLEGDRLGFDIHQCFQAIDQSKLKRKLDRLSPTLWHRLIPWIPKSGLATGVAFSPDLANLYLSDIDHRFPTAVRYADNIIIVEPEPEKVFRKMQKQLADLGLECHTIEANPVVFCKQPLPPLNATRSEVIAAPAA